MDDNGIVPDSHPSRHAAPTATRVGLFGGSFDPPHIGHLILAHDALEALHLDEIWWIPAYQSPHKGSTAYPVESRISMIEGMIAQDPQFRCCGIEVETGRTRYSVETAEDLCKRHPRHHFWWLMGSDQIAQLHRWKDPHRLAKLVRIAVWQRPGTLIECDPSIASIPVETIPARLLDISSTEIRKRIEQKLPVHMFLHPFVNGFMHKIQSLQTSDPASH
jgi:nicotinate-nucleotide adenylyltransferase